MTAADQQPDLSSSRPRSETIDNSNNSENVSETVPRPSQREFSIVDRRHLARLILESGPPTVRRTRWCSGSSGGSYVERSHFSDDSSDEEEDSTAVETPQNGISHDDDANPHVGEEPAGTTPDAITPAPNEPQETQIIFRGFDSSNTGSDESSMVPALLDESREPTPFSPARGNESGKDVKAGDNTIGTDTIERNFPTNPDSWFLNPRPAPPIPSADSPGEKEPSTTRVEINERLLAAGRARLLSRIVERLRRRGRRIAEMLKGLRK